MTEGEQYLIVVHRDSIIKGDPPFLHTTSCERTRSVRHAKADLRILLAENPQQGRRVVGQVLPTSLSGYGLKYDKPIGGAVVTLRGHRTTVRAMTDADGVYDIQGLPVGIYTATVQLPKGFRAKPLEVDLSNGACADGTMAAIPSGGVKGVVRDLVGNPVSTYVYIVPLAPGPPEIEEWKNVRSDENGQFHLLNIPAGEYWIGVNLNQAPSRLTPFARTFYPGVNDISSAARIQVGRETVQLSTPFQLDPLPLRPIEVIVKHTSGALVAKSSVFLRTPEGTYANRIVDLVSTDDHGFARLHAPELRVYVVRASRAPLCSEEVIVDPARTSPLILVLSTQCNPYED